MMRFTSFVAAAMFLGKVSQQKIKMFFHTRLLRVGNISSEYPLHAGPSQYSSHELVSQLIRLDAAQYCD